MRAAAICALTVLAACGGPGGGIGQRTPSPVAGLTLLPRAGGIEVVGSGGREIGFGRDRDGALATAARIAGRRPEAVTCLPGREGLRVAPDLVMVFSDTTFTGWQAGGASAGTPCA